ncbi:MAG: ABC transporter ATP-binding protein/permease [Actinomycetia bacterium]|nr:ABC transporter ATP-binding protein/permease [Actinomycetes bacterium]
MGKLLKRYLIKPYWVMMIAILLATGLQAGAQLSLPNAMSDIVDVGIMQRGVEGDATKLAVQEKIAVSSNSTQMRYIMKKGALMLGIALLTVIGAVLAGFFCSWSSAALARDLREKVFTRVEAFSLKEFDKFSTASLIIRSTNDVQQVQQMTFMLARLGVMAPMMSVGALIMAIQKGGRLSLIIAVIIPVLILIMAIAIRFVMPLFRSVQEKNDRLNMVSREGLTGVRVIRAFNRQNFQQGRFKIANDSLTDTQMKAMHIVVMMIPAVMFVVMVGQVAAVWFGSKMISTNSLEIGNMMAFIQYTMQMLMSLMMFAFILVMLPRAAVSGERIREVLETEPVILDPDAKTTEAVEKTLKRAPASLEFKGVSFYFEGGEEAAVKDIDFKAKRGTTTAVIGSTGSGKSTILNLVERLYDVSEGKILVNGVDVREHTQYDLHDRVGYVPQKAVLFSGTIADNIRFGKPDATDEEVREALKTAQAEDFIEELEEGIEAYVAQGGTNFSGGQKQRLAIARALVKKPQIYLFDDSFSALDLQTDANLRAAIKPLLKDSLAVIVAQRISTIMDADQIIVLDEGKVVGLGTHDELLANNTVYQEIAKSQLSEEELAHA